MKHEQSIVCAIPGCPWTASITVENDAGPDDHADGWYGGQLAQWRTGRLNDALQLAATRHVMGAHVMVSGETSTSTWRHADGTVRVDHMDASPGDYYGPLLQELRSICPDGGTCHHLCIVAATCFRVSCCEPLSGIYPDDVWPAGVT